MTFYTKNVGWEQEQHKLRKIREKVFVCQWRIPKECEFDYQDRHAFHILVFDERDHEIATGRITPKGEIGRIAVEPEYRGAEVYRLLFDALLAIAKQNALEEVVVQCELDGVNYYRQQGFRPVGTVYMDAGTPRQPLMCRLSEFSLARVELTH
jgi:predicted GNAT family N-acyltransferase